MREGPARDAAVLRDAAGEREEKRDEDQRQSDDGQNDVAREQREIKRAEGGVERIADVAVQRVMGDVAHEKQRGEDEGRDHRRAVLLDVVRADEGVADQERSGGEAVEDCVHGGQEGVLRAGGRGGMNIDEPEKKERGGGADGDDDGDGGAGGGARSGGWGSDGHAR